MFSVLSLLFIHLHLPVKVDQVCSYCSHLLNENLKLENSFRELTGHELKHRTPPALHL